ncbi:MAG TPA: ferritin-like domain-containing protein [Solirubrobacteraceae bacterium]|nr:ferritin-like domain-containing protein [Solirubrobacteraceae bacterium]
MGRLATRRQLVVGAVAAAGSGAAVAAGITAAADPALADAPPVSDAEALSKALEVERLMVLAYRRVLSSGTLAPDTARALAPYLGHEIEHVSAVAAALAAIGVNADTGPLSLDAAGDALSKHNIPVSLTDLGSQNDSMRLLVDLESVAEGVYFTALKTLSTTALQRLAAEIMACEAQHWTAVSGLRNPGEYVKAVPWPFVTGSS